jgi:hypothetical protein
MPQKTVHHLCRAPSTETADEPDHQAPRGVRRQGKGRPRRGGLGQPGRDTAGAGQAGGGRPGDRERGFQDRSSSRFLIPSLEPDGEYSQHPREHVDRFFRESSFGYAAVSLGMGQISSGCIDMALFSERLPLSLHPRVCSVAEELINSIDFGLDPTVRDVQDGISGCADSRQCGLQKPISTCACQRAAPTPERGPSCRRRLLSRRSPRLA